MHRLRHVDRCGFFAIAVALLLPACAVSFDGYVLGKDAGTGGSSGDGGTGGAGAAGAGGAMGGAGGTGATAGTGGTTGGAGGTGGTTGGAGGTGGTTGGAGGTGGTTGGAGGTGGTTGGAGGTGGSAPCPTNLNGPAMVHVAISSTAGFCIDESEVTNKQYEIFLKANPDPTKQIAACSWNTGFDPQTSSQCSTLLYDPANKPDYPVSCVDWCDAVAYCAWAGKRLCGKIGGGALLPGHYADATQSQWYAACSEQGARAFPYGNTYHGAYCNGLDYPASVTTIPVKQASLCVGGYDGIYDMSGNVAEWEDACTGNGSGASCLYRGGGYLDFDSGSSNLRCDSAPLGQVTERVDTRGFRCCYDP